MFTGYKRVGSPPALLVAIATFDFVNFSLTSCYPHNIAYVRELRLLKLDSNVGN